MRTRIGIALVLLLVLVGVITAAENPFPGTWKLNLSKSKVTGDTMTFEKTASGAIRYTASGVSYTFKVDGTEYKGAFADDLVAWKQIDDHTWEDTFKRRGRLESTETTKLSADGKTMTVVSRGTKTNGEKWEATTVYERLTGDKGLIGKWRDKEAKMNVGSPSILVIKASGADGLMFTIGSTSGDLKFDGKDYPIMGAGVATGTTLALKRTGPRSLDVVTKSGGKPYSRETYTVSQDGSIMTVKGSSVAVNEPYTVIYERQ